MIVWLAWSRGFNYGESEPPGAAALVGVYATREKALQFCWPTGDSRWVEERKVIE